MRLLIMIVCLVMNSIIREKEKIKMKNMKKMKIMKIKITKIKIKMKK